MADTVVAGPAGAAPDATAGPGAGTAPGAARAGFRFFRSELRQVFCRRRNVILLGVVALFPILIGVGLRLASHPHRGGGGNGGAALLPPPTRPPHLPHARPPRPRPP